MAGKFISSRVDEKTDELERLQSLLFVCLDTLGDDTDIPAERPELLDALDDSVLELADEYNETLAVNGAMAGDLISLSVSNVNLGVELSRAANVIAGLTSDPSVPSSVNTKILDRSLELFLKESLADLSGNAIQVYSAEQLKEGLIAAIGYYNNELADHLIGP
jgi:hypothetical protein